MRELSVADRLTLACLGAAVVGMMVLAAASGRIKAEQQQKPGPCVEVRR